MFVVITLFFSVLLPSLASSQQENEFSALSDDPLEMIVPIKENSEEPVMPKIETPAFFGIKKGLGVSLFIVLIGLVASIIYQYYNTTTRKGTALRGPKSKARILSTVKKEASKSRKSSWMPASINKVKEKQETFHKSMETYLVQRKCLSAPPALPSAGHVQYAKNAGDNPKTSSNQPKWAADQSKKTADQPAKTVSQSKVSTYADEYWQRQKESFWKRVKKAASTPSQIQDITIKRVQEYNQELASIRQAKDDLYVTHDPGSALMRKPSPKPVSKILQKLSAESLPTSSLEPLLPLTPRPVSLDNFQKQAEPEGRTKKSISEAKVPVTNRPAILDQLREAHFK